MRFCLTGAISQSSTLYQMVKQPLPKPMLWLTLYWFEVRAVKYDLPQMLLYDWPFALVPEHLRLDLKLKLATPERAFSRYLPSCLEVLCISQ